MKQDPAAEKAFGWILEMYAFSIASAIKPGEPIQYELHPELMIQPPWDQTLTVRPVTCADEPGASARHVRKSWHLRQVARMPDRGNGIPVRALQLKHECRHL